LFRRSSHLHVARFSEPQELEHRVADWTGLVVWGCGPPLSTGVVIGAVSTRGDDRCLVRTWRRRAPTTGRATDDASGKRKNV